MVGRYARGGAFGKAKPRLEFGLQRSRLTPWSVPGGWGAEPGIENRTTHMEGCGNMNKFGAWVMVGVAAWAWSVPAQDGAWIDLFDGETLNGWTQRNGTAVYAVEDGAIVGTTADGSPNSFLCSDAEYGDFELQFDVRVHPRLNSGVQIRSKTQGEDPRGRVNGPQVEIEASGDGGAESGYIYGEATGHGWLTPPDRLKPHKHFRDGDWNHYRVVARGPRIQTWINGTEIEDLTHEEIHQSHPSGFIGLQVHSIGRDQGPYTVAWKNIRLRTLAPSADADSEAQP